MKTAFKLLFTACLMTGTPRVFCMANPRTAEIDRKIKLVRNFALSFGTSVGSSSCGVTRLAMGKLDASGFIAIPAFAYALVHMNNYLKTRKEVNAQIRKDYDKIFSYTFSMGLFVGVVSSSIVNRCLGFEFDEDDFAINLGVASSLAIGLGASGFIALPAFAYAHRDNDEEAEPFFPRNLPATKRLLIKAARAA